MASSSKKGDPIQQKAIAEAKRRLVDKWSSAIDPETGTFESSFGDPSRTPYAVRVRVFYDDLGEISIDIAQSGVESGNFDAEVSFSEQQLHNLKELIQEALPLLDRQIYEFAQVVINSLLLYDDDESFFDSEFEEYTKLTGNSEGEKKSGAKNQTDSRASSSRAVSAASSSSAPVVSSAKMSPTIEFKLDSNYVFTLESYNQQTKRWPGRGQHILGTFTDTAIMVYQAFSHQIADYAVREQKFTGAPGYSTTRMTWIKPNFLWMMYRSSWGRSKNQERVLGVWLKKDAFLNLLRHSVHTSSSAAEDDWSSTSTTLDPLPGWKGRVRLQWDPDHGPNGEPVGRRAIQIGIKNVPWWHTGECFEKIIDVTPLMIEQRVHVPSSIPQLYTPQERIFVIPDKAIAKHVKTETTQSHLDEETSYLSALSKKSRKKAANSEEET